MRLIEKKTKKNCVMIRPTEKEIDAPNMPYLGINNKLRTKLVKPPTTPPNMLCLTNPEPTSKLPDKPPIDIDANPNESMIKLTLASTYSGPKSKIRMLSLRTRINNKKEKVQVTTHLSKKE